VRAMDRDVKHGDFWVRRIAMLHQLGLRGETDTARLFKYAELLATEKEFFIRKAIGWALRDYAWHDWRAVERFLKTSEVKFSGLTVREAGKNFAAAGQHQEAARRFAVAGKLEPDSLEAHFLSGLEWGRDNQHAAAAKEFRETVRLRPDVAETHLNLGMAYLNSGDLTDSLAEISAVLEKNPTNEMALHYARLVREKLAAEGHPPHQP